VPRPVNRKKRACKLGFATAHGALPIGSAKGRTAFQNKRRRSAFRLEPGRAIREKPSKSATCYFPGTIASPARFLPTRDINHPLGEDDE
jgi:hypothetical protein